MLIVSNTSPVLNLAIVDHLSLMYEQFGEILIPQAVFEELRVEEGLPGSQSIREAIEKGWFGVKEVKDRIFVKALRADLDKGEAEAIALALQVKSEYVILDEREGRRVAKLLGLKVIGVCKLQSLKSAMDDLRKKAGFHIASELYSYVLKKGGEKYG